MRAVSPFPTDTAAPPARPATEAVDVSVVVVTYNVREFLEQALGSVERASAGLNVETWVVDNDSADGTAAMVRERFPDVHLIANEDNVGFAVANNQALRQARGRYVLVLNPDTLLQEDTLREMVAFMDAHPDTGAAGCRILNPDGTFAPESRRAFPTPSVAFFRLVGLGRLFPRSPVFGRYNLTYLPQDEPCEVDALSGSCMMVRREAMWGESPDRETRPTGEPAEERAGAAGVFDESFFMYGEDLDWSYRIQQAGWSIRYTPATRIVHYKGESTKKGDLRYVLLFYGAMLRFVEKHLAGRGQSLWGQMGSALLRLGLHLGILARAGLAAGARAVGAISRPGLDLALAWGAMSLAALAWSLPRGFAFGAGTYALALPAFAATLVAGIGLAGGYGARGGRVRTVLGGAALGFLGVATASYLVPTLAFSRGAVLTGFAVAALALVAGRLRARRRTRERRRALVVGSGADAARLRDLAAGRLALDVVGYVGDASEADVPHLGPTRHLRDLVRLRGVGEVVFAADRLTNSAILDGMRALRDLPVQLKILAAHRDRIIGKASVEDLSGPLVAAERAIAPLRSGGSRRALEVPIALVLLALRPLLRALCRRPDPTAGRPSAFTCRLAALAEAMPDVLARRRALVGYDPAGAHPPPAWGLEPGVVSILDTLPARPTAILDTQRAYWSYARNQSAALDLEILYQALARPDVKRDRA